MAKVLDEYQSRSGANYYRRNYINYNKAYRPELKKKGAVSFAQKVEFAQNTYQLAQKVGGQVDE